MIGQLYGVFDNAGEFLQLVHSSIFFRGVPSAKSHRGEARRVVAKFADGMGDGVGIVGVGDNSAAGFADNSRGGAFERGDDEYRAPGGERGIEFAWDDHAFEAALYGDDV